jgi:hypothetical protein
MSLLRNYPNQPSTKTTSPFKKGASIATHKKEMGCENEGDVCYVTVDRR